MQSGGRIALHRASRQNFSVNKLQDAEEATCRKRNVNIETDSRRCSSPPRAGHLTIAELQNHTGGSSRGAGPGYRRLHA